MPKNIHERNVGRKKKLSEFDKNFKLVDKWFLLMIINDNLSG